MIHFTTGRKNRGTGGRGQDCTQYRMVVGAPLFEGSLWTTRRRR